MIDGKLPTTVEAPCGTINHGSGQGTGRLNVDGSKCGRSASRFVKTDDMSTEILVCGQHLEKAKDRVREVETEREPIAAD